MADYARVIQGTQLVLRQALRRGGPEVQRRVDRAIFHISELAKVATEAIHYYQQNPNQQPHSSTKEPHVSPSETSQTPYDPIGFDKVEEMGPESTNGNSVEDRPAASKHMRARAVPS
eukprot:gene8287-10218_t